MVYHNQHEETLSAEELQALQREKLARLLSAIAPSNRFYRETFGNRLDDPSKANLSDLPFTTRAELQEDQRRHPPYGSTLSFPIADYVRLHQTSGSMGAPLRWLDTAESWDWFVQCWQIIFRAGSVGPRDRVIFPFSFGPFIGFWAAFEAATRIGAMVLPAGGMSTAGRLRFLTENHATIVCCTPTYALHMAEQAQRDGIDLGRAGIRALIVAGEPGGNIPETRAKIEAAWNARVLDHAGMTEAGPWGFEPIERPNGLNIIESEFIAEVVTPGGDAPVDEGEIGELVITNLGRTASPLIRYRTGDLVRLTRPGPIGGRNFAWLEGGVLGRADDMLFVRGNNVFPSAIEGILRGFGEVAEFRLHAGARGALVELLIEVEPAADAPTDGLAERIAAGVRDRLHFKPQVRLAAPGALPRFELKARRLVRNTGAETATPGNANS